MSKLAICGESWGADEAKAKQAFVGKAGEKFWALCAKLGIKREDVTVLSVMNEQPPKNDFGIYYKDEKRLEPTNKLLHAWHDLGELVFKSDITCVLALGTEALRAFVGYKKVSKYRGTVFYNGTYKIVGTYHPSYANRKHRLPDGTPIEPVMLLDMQRALKESRDNRHVPMERTRIVEPNYSTCKKHLMGLIEFAGKNVVDLSVDIETMDGLIDRVGIATSPTWAICIPFYNNDGMMWPIHQRTKLYYLLKKLLEHPNVRIVGQNFFYDNYWFLRGWNIKINREHIIFDNYVAMKVLYPDLPADLAFQTSIMTDIGYYKDDRKITEGKKIDFWKRGEYCCNDALATYECYLHLKLQL